MAWPCISPPATTFPTPSPSGINPSPHPVGNRTNTCGREHHGTIKTPTRQDGVGPAPPRDPRGTLRRGGRGPRRRTGHPGPHLAELRGGGVPPGGDTPRVHRD